MVLTAMSTLQGSGCAVAMIGWLAAAVFLPERASAQPAGADRLGVVPTGLYLSAAASLNAADAPPSLPAVAAEASKRKDGIETEMGRTARNARKPAPSLQPALQPVTTAAFMPPRGKPPLEQVSVEPPPAEQPVSTDSGSPSGQAEPAARAEEAQATEQTLEQTLAARPPEAVATEMTDEGLREGASQASPLASALPGAIASLAFAPGSAALSSDAERVLKDLAARFSAEDPAVRLQLMAFAGGEDISASKARRLSLARALAVRSYLMANGIEGTRMDVRALGDRTLGPAANIPQNRVDIAMIKR